MTLGKKTSSRYSRVDRTILHNKISSSLGRHTKYSHIIYYGIGVCESWERVRERLTARCSGLLVLWDSWSSWWLSSLSRSCRSHTIHINTFFFSQNQHEAYWESIYILHQTQMPKSLSWIDLKNVQHVWHESASAVEQEAQETWNGEEATIYRRPGRRHHMKTCHNMKTWNNWTDQNTDIKNAESNPMCLMC